jgi:hypothetical protein
MCLGSFPGKIIDPLIAQSMSLSMGPDDVCFPQLSLRVKLWVQCLDTINALSCCCGYFQDTRIRYVQDTLGFASQQSHGENLEMDGEPGGAPFAFRSEALNSAVIPGRLATASARISDLCHRDSR